MLPLPILMVADVAEKPTFSDSLPYLVGFLVVLFTLTVLWIICATIGKLLKRSTPQAVAVKSKAVPFPASDDAVSPETLVVIAAAVEAAVGSGRRVVSVKPQSTSWQAAGRNQIQSSHNIR